MFSHNESSDEPAETFPRRRQSAQSAELSVDELVFVGFNSRIAALNRATGELVWQWKAPSGTGFVAILLERDQLVVSVSGYTYALDPATGDTLWENLLKGFGYGIPCLVSTAGSTLAYSAAAAETAAQQAQQAAAHNTTQT